jgi:hypothetical protein
MLTVTLLLPVIQLASKNKTLHLVNYCKYENIRLYLCNMEYIFIDPEAYEGLRDRRSRDQGPFRS